MNEIEPAVVLVRVFHAPCAEVYRAWTDPTMLRRWLVPGANIVEHAETDLQVGGCFLLRTRGPDGAQHRITGRYRALQAGRHILQTWIYDGPLDLLRGEETLLQIDLTPLGTGSTEMRLTHKRITRVDVREAYTQDWPSCFDKLDAILQ